MNVEKTQKLPPPPGIFGSLRTGFDVVSSHVWLILLPILLDVFLWLGPRLSAGEVYSSILASLLEILRTRPLPAADMLALTESVENFSRFNWLSWARTFPVGISSLQAFAVPEGLSSQTPLGLQGAVQVSSLLSLFGWTLCLTLLGWVGGSLYFRWVSVTALGEEEAGIGLLRAITQTSLLSVVLFVGLLIITVPVAIFIGLLTFVSPVVSSGILFVILLLSYWLIVPLFFMPHGIFTRKQNALHSVLSSVRMSRFTLPTSGMFVFCVFLLTIGLDYLWKVPKNDSWMTLVGIAGHAFITTALLAASFVFYRDMNVWLQTVFAQMQQKQGIPTQQV